MSDKSSAKYLVAPARHPDESYEDYKARRTDTNKYLRKRLQKGRIFWPSSEAGTLVQEE